MNLLFDLDGTLTDPFPGITNSILHSLGQLGRSLPERDSLKWCIGPPLQDSFAGLLDSTEPGLIRSAVNHYRQYFSSNGMFENTVYEDIKPALQHLQKQGHNLFVATSKPRVFAEKIIQHFELDPFFTHVYGSELDGTRNDKSELIQYLMQQQQLLSAECVMFGDRKHDMIGAKANDLRPVGVLWGYGSRQELQSAGAKTCLDSPRQLLSGYWHSNDTH